MTVLCNQNLIATDTEEEILNGQDTQPNDVYLSKSIYQ